MENKDLTKTEGRIQAECFEWFNNSFPELRGLLYHVPNGGKRSAKEANDFKAMGVVAGVPDLEFHFWKRTFFLECKTPEGTVQPVQKKIHAILTEHGFRVFIFRSLEEFQNIVWAIIQDKSYLYQRGNTKEDYFYKHGVFNYIYEMPEGNVQLISDLVTEENRDKFKGILVEFISDTYDKLDGFELLFTPDYLGFYKKSLEGKTEVFYDGKSTIEIPE